MKFESLLGKSAWAVVMAAGVMATVPATFAATEKTAAPMKLGAAESGMTEWLAEKIGLSDEQKNKISELTASQREAMEKSRQGLSELHRKMQDAIEAGDEAAATAAAAEIGKATGISAVQRIKLKKQIDAILTPEQQAKSAEIRKEQKERMSRMREIINARMKERTETAGAVKTAEPSKNAPAAPQPVPAQPVPVKTADAKK